MNFIVLCMGCKGSEVRVFSPRQIKAVYWNSLFYLIQGRGPARGRVLVWDARGSPDHMWRDRPDKKLYDEKQLFLFGVNRNCLPAGEANLKSFLSPKTKAKNFVFGG
jgi:hypothetical protein